MKWSLVFLLLAACFAVGAQPAAPRMTTVEPLAAKAGDVVTVTGENLQKDVVSKVFLTDDNDDKKDVQCEVTEQTATSIKIKVPAKASGRMSVMVLSGGKYIIQPVKLTVE